MRMKYISTFRMSFLVFFLTIFLIMPAGVTHAASDLQVAGWIPYWRDSQSIKDAQKRISQIDTIYPFAFTAQPNGTIKDLAGLEEEQWQKLHDYLVQYGALSGPLDDVNAAYTTEYLDQR